MTVEDPQDKARRLFICPSVADFGLEIGKLISIRQIEFVLENRCAGIAIVIGNGVTSSALGLSAISLNDGFPLFLRRRVLERRDRRLAFHAR
jgi:hypothetical protein